jgi:hypothetical protein
VTEADWLACTQLPAKNSYFHKVSRRKWRFFLVGCCRQVWHVVTDYRCRRAIENETTEATKVHATRDEALADKPSDAKMKLYRVTAPERDPVFVWAKWGKSALMAAAGAAGWKASSEGKAPDKTEVADMLSRLSVEEREAIIAMYNDAYPNGKGLKRK